MCDSKPELHEFVLRLIPELSQSSPLHRPLVTFDFGNQQLSSIVTNFVTSCRQPSVMQIRHSLQVSLILTVPFGNSLVSVFASKGGCQWSVDCSHFCLLSHPLPRTRLKLQLNACPYAGSFFTRMASDISSTPALSEAPRKSKSTSPAP